MNIRRPKSYNNLPTREKQLIAKMMNDECEARMDEQEVQLFIQFMKLMCIALHECQGYGRQRLLITIGYFTNIRRKFRKIKTGAELDAVLDKEMDRIFKGDFPAEFVERLQRGEQ